MIRAISTIVGGVLLLAGCAGSRNIEQESNFDLCRTATLGSWVGAAARSRAEIIARGLIEPGEWALIVDDEIRIGMTECAALAATYTGPKPRPLNGEYRFGDYNMFIVDDYDPSTPSAAYMNWIHNRAYGNRAPRVKQKYVPKYLITVNESRVVDCYSVNLQKVGRTENLADLFPLPCMKDVPGFERD